MVILFPFFRLTPEMFLFVTTDSEQKRLQTGEM